MSIELADGSTLAMRTPRRAGDPLKIRIGGPIRERYFAACPICGAPATADEHVPPRSMGGRAMTRTCAPCNNDLGSKVEADLVDWHDDAITLPSFIGDAVPGHRRASRLTVRSTPDGSFVLLMDGDADPAIRDLLLSGQLDLTALEPDRNRVRLGLLKHAFLAAFLLGGPLEGPAADAVRADLLAARNARRRQDVPRSEIALGLTVLRSSEPLPVDWPLAHGVAVEEDGTEIKGVLLAHTTFVSWNWKPVQEIEDDRRVHVTLTVGKPLEGVVRTGSDS